MEVLRQHQVMRPDGTEGFEDFDLIEVSLPVDQVEDVEVDVEVDVEGCTKCGALYLTDLASLG